MGQERSSIPNTKRASTPNTDLNLSDFLALPVLLLVQPLAHRGLVLVQTLLVLAKRIRVVTCFSDKPLEAKLLIK
jgi:hypothetical protein